MRKKLLRLVRIAPLALLFAGAPAFAQTTGTLIGVVTDASTGKPVPGAVIVARSPNLQGEQTAVTDANGNYRITLLPPGAYTLAVQLEGYKPAERSDLTIRPDKTIRANLAVVPEAVRMEEQVVKTGTAPAVNIGSAESGAVVSREFIANVPVGRTVEAVSATVPTASGDLYGVGFAGAQSAENAYILDGLNVTDPVYGTFGGNPNAQILPPSILNNFVQEVDVKTGGFMPEYGRTTGGVLNTVTRSGSNEFHGSVFSNFTPRFLFQPSGNSTGVLTFALIDCEPTSKMWSSNDLRIVSPSWRSASMPRPLQTTANVCSLRRTGTSNSFRWLRSSEAMSPSMMSALPKPTASPCTRCRGSRTSWGGCS